MMNHSSTRTERSAGRPLQEITPVDVLIVDDEAANRVALRAVLDQPGIRLVEAASGGEALHCLLEGDYALILLDVMMPDMSGFEVAELVHGRDRTKTTPIAFLTGNAADRALIERGYSLGAVDYLVKPVIPAMVRAKVAVFAELYRQKQRIAEQGAKLVAAARQENEMRLLELQLASEHRFRNLAEAVPEIIWVSGADGAVEYINRRWYEYTGLGPEERIGAAAESGGGCGVFRSVLHPDDLAPLDAAWSEGMRTRTQWQAAVRLRDREGGYRWHLARAIPETTRSGAGVSWIGTLTDIAEQKDVEEKIARAYEGAREAVAARDEFMSVASHELRTPLSSLQLVVDLFLGHVRAEDDTITVPLAKVRLAARQVERLERLVTELLEISRITSGRLVLERQSCDLSALAREAVRRLEDNAARAGSAIELRADEPVRAFVDPSRFEQVLTNLLTNAIKFGAEKPITVIVERLDGNARLCVCDQGIGIAHEDVDRIFRPFERAVSTRAYGGLGLGLFIVRQIIEAQGGSIRVESEKDAGSKFIVTFPLDGSQ